MTEQNTSPLFPIQIKQSNNQLCKEGHPNLTLFIGYRSTSFNSIYHLKERYAFGSFRSLVSTKVNEME